MIYCIISCLCIQHNIIRMAPRMPKYPKITKNIQCSQGIDPLKLLLIFIVVCFAMYIAHQYWTYHHNRNIRNRPETVLGVNPDNFLIPRPVETNVVSPVNLGGISSRFMDDFWSGSPPLWNPTTKFEGSFATGELWGTNARLDVLNDPYVPPVKLDGYVWNKTSGDVRGLPPIIAPIQTLAIMSRSSMVLPVNVETRGVRSEYNQVGILTKTDGNSGSSGIKMFSNSDPVVDSSYENTLIIPLMGRRSSSGRNKWQYYTISNTGTLNTKLPVTVQGRSCSSEYGCDEIMDGDVVFVKGYNHGFSVTMYENTTFSYIPVL